MRIAIANRRHLHYSLDSHVGVQELSTIGGILEDQGERPTPSSRASRWATTQEGLASLTVPAWNQPRDRLREMDGLRAVLGGGSRAGAAAVRAAGAAPAWRAAW